MKFSELLLSIFLFVSTKRALTTSHDVTGNLGELVLTCRHGWKLYQGNCYLVVDLQRTFNDAKSICERQGGELWYFENEFEYSDFLKPIAPSQIWTGLHRVNEEWIMHGEDTNLRTLHGWADNMPDETGGIDCSFVDSQDGMLTEDCDQMHAFVCKQTSCLEGYMPCATGGKCINISRDVCNDRYECDDRSDERHCPSKCSTYSSLMDPSGTITIDGIQDDTDCTWVLEAPIGKLVKLTIQGMTLEMNRAFIEAWTGRPTIPGSRPVKSLTGTFKEQIVYSDNNFLIIRVYAGDLERPIGRRVLSWTTDIPNIVEGEKELEATENFRYLEFPFGENSPQGVTLSWRITAPKGELITYVAELKDSTKYGEDANVYTILDGVGSSGLDGPVYLSTYHTSASNVISISMEYTTTINDYQIKFIKGCNLEVEVNWDLDFSSPGFEYSDSTPNYPANVKCEWSLISNKAFSFILDQRDLASDDRSEPTLKSVDTLKVCGYDESGNEIASQCWENEDIPYGSSNEQISFERKAVVTFESGPALSGIGFWFGAVPDCPQLDVSSYTHMTPNSSRADYENLSCLDGYRFNVQKYTDNELSIRCTKPNGEWDRELLPECQIVYCGTPDEIDNGYISNVTGVMYESKAYYTCNDGFTMTSSDEVTCQRDGDWSTRPTCTSSSCSVLQQNVIPNSGFTILEGSINNRAEFNTVVQFYCNDQFELKGVDISHCTNQGWTHVLLGYGLPECIDIRCPVLYIEHGTHISAIERVTCDHGYQIYYPGIDDKESIYFMDIHCQHDRIYTFDVTCVDTDECSEDINNCDDLTSTCENMDGSYNCNCLQGYQKVGGVCSDKDECSESPCDVNDNGFCQNNVGSYICSCDSGYVLYTGRGTEGFNHPSIETAEMVGDVYRINHSCVRKQCDALTSVPNGLYLKKELTFFHYEDSVELQCSDGYHIDGMSDNVVSMVSTCEADGEWYNLYTCTKRRCELPLLPQNGVFYDKTDVFFGDTVKLTCTMTASTTRELSAKCIYESSTVMQLVGDDLTVCPEIDCGNPADVLPPGSTVPVLQTTKHLDQPSFVFSCDTGYQHIAAEGSSTTVTCGEEGRWLLDTNTCIGESCPDPGTPGDATQMAESYEPGSILYYDCTRPGFMPILNGQENGSYTCTQNGNSAFWSPLLTIQLPVCKDVTQPAFLYCPSDTVYDAMDTVFFTEPQQSDNFGVKSLRKNSATINGKVILETTDVTYTATDFEDRVETCAFRLRVIDRNVKPNLNCPASVDYPVVNNSQTVVNVANYVSVSGGSIDTITPSQVTANIARIGSATTVTVTASNEDNTKSTCKFMIYFTGACFEESLYPDSNSQRDCTNTDGSLSCTSTCRTNHVYDNGATSKTFTCSGTNNWNFADLDLFCLPYKNHSAFAMDAFITHEYDDVNQGCLDEFDVKLESSLNTFRERLKNACGGIWDVTIVNTRTADKITEFGSTLRLELVDTSNIDREVCRQSIEDDLVGIFAVIGNNLVCNGVSHHLVVDETDSSIGAASLRCTDESYHETNNINFGFICVPCGYGYFYNGDTMSCQPCPADQYQDTVNQFECKNCPNSQAPDIRSIECIAGACFEESLYPDSNAQRDCTQGTDGSLSCTSTCNTNYVYDNGATSKTFTCSGTYVWNFADLDLDLFCLPYTNPAYAMDAFIIHEYDEVNQLCLPDFNVKLESSLQTFRQRLGNKCGGIWNVAIVSTRKADKITEFESTLRLELVDTSNTDREVCRQSIEDDLVGIFAVIGNNLVCNGVSQQLVVEETDSSLGAASLRCTDESYHETNNINFGGLICVPCGYGYFYNGDTMSCQPCPAGQYQNTVNQLECKNCPNSRAPDAKSIECIATCPSGYWSTNGFYPCTPCPVDQYWTDYKTCTPCPIGESTVGQTGTTSETQCYAPCPAGSYSRTAYNIPGTGCSLCPRNFYQGLSGQSVCVRCPKNSITSSTGNIAIAGSCTTIEEVCDRSFCDNHGDCDYSYNERFCICDDGYFGDQCTIRRHICDFKPCTNGGQCVEGDTIDAYTCTCASVELDQCNMVIMFNDKTGRLDIGALYNTINLGSGSTQEMCEILCVNDAACLEASYLIIGTANGKCFLYNEANVPTMVNDLDTQVHMRKICINAFEGENCQIDNINECANYGCDSTASCKDKIDGAECLCSTTAGNTGDKCEIARQPCSPNPCDSTGTAECVPFGNVRYLCYCRPGYTGQHCETNIDECDLHGQPCLNGGTCRDGINDWSCQCVSGYSGTSCENEPNYCRIISCDGDNVCYNNLNKDEAVCSCYDDGYYVKNSDGECVRVNFPCDTKGCINGACRHLSSSYKEAVCDCESGFTGSLCQHSVDDCNNNLCQNGECQDGYEEYTCLCQDGYTGRYCSENIDECEDSTCNPNNSKCVDGVFGYTCDCNTGYKGINCEEDINECEDYPCQHGGTCTTIDEVVGTYKCECGDSWTGTNCQTRVNLCPGRNCNNNGQCYTLVDSTFCRCSGAAQGENCEDVKDVCELFQEQGVDLCVNGKCVNSDGSAHCQCNQEYNKEQCFFVRMDGYSGQANVDNDLTQKGSQYTQETCQTRCLNIADCEAVMVQVDFCFYYRTGNVDPKPSKDEILFVRQCPSDYAGDSCELIKSWCEDDNNPCQNGATCRELAPRGYACDCQPGYSGPTCNIAANTCSSNPCGSQAMCRSTLTEYICMCPQGREFDGTNCRVCNTNYVLLVNTLAGESTAGLITAFRMHTTELSFILRIRVHAFVKTTTPVLFTLLGSNGLKPVKDGSTFILEMNKDGVKVTGEDNQEGALNFEATDFGQDLLDGEWHFIAGAINSDGDLSMSVNAVTSDIINVLSSGLDVDVNAQIRLGEGVLAEYEDVTVYDTYLTTLDRNLANVDDFSKPESIIQDWCNYELSTSTSRKAQRSTISLKQDENTSPPDLQCIDDPIYITPPGVQGQRIVLRQDNQIKTRLNSIQESNRGLEYNDSLPDVMRFGFYSGIVVGFDQYGNYAECRFSIYIRANEQCPAHESPETSPLIEICDKRGSVCGLTCSNSATRVSAPTPKYTPCGSLGVYNTDHPYQNPVWPPCTLVVSTKFVVTAYMDFTTHTNCAVTSNQQLKNRFNDVFDEIEKKWVDICDVTPNEDQMCTYLDLMPVQCTDGAKMITVGFTLELPGNQLTYLGGTKMDVHDAINIIILEEKLIDLSNLNGAELLEDSVVIKVEEKCTSTGYNLVKTGKCAPCGKGFYYNGNDDVEKCMPCPIGQYQNQEAQLECMPCMVDTTTYQMGAASSDQCIEICSVGKYMLDGSCEPCPRHTYQDIEGQNFCKVCELGYKTISEESTSIVQCLVDCPAGEERDSASNLCMQCARGFWRSIVWDDCQPCNEGTTTMQNSIDVSDDDCDMIICVVGEYWTGGVCEPCGSDKYQNMTGQTSCHDCPPNTFHDQVRQTSVSNCLRFCNQNANYCTSRGTCVETGRRTASCDCRDGYSGNTCQNKDEEEEGKALPLAYIAGGVGGGMLVIVVVAIVIVVARRRRNRHKDTRRRPTSLPGRQEVDPGFRMNITDTTRTHKDEDEEVYDEIKDELLVKHEKDSKNTYRDGNSHGDDQMGGQNGERNSVLPAELESHGYLTPLKSDRRSPFPKVDDHYYLDLDKRKTEEKNDSDKVPGEYLELSSIRDDSRRYACLNDMDRALDNQETIVKSYGGISRGNADNDGYLSASERKNMDHQNDKGIPRRNTENAPNYNCYM